MPFSDRSGISRKIEEPKERERLRKVLRELDIPEGVGVIIRTVGEGQRARYFVRDFASSAGPWAKVDQAIGQPGNRAGCLKNPIWWSARCAIFLRRTVKSSATIRGNDRMIDMVGQISRRARNRVRHYDVPRRFLRLRCAETD